MRITGGDTDAPKVVRSTFWIWIAAGTVGLLHAVYLLTLKNRFADQEVQRNTDPTVSADHIRDVVGSVITFALVEAVVFAAVWAFFAYRARAGARGGRIGLVVTGLVYLALNILLPLGNAVLLLIEALLVVAGIILLFLRGSREYFSSMR
ncbi:hypothetical protein GCM10029964_116660 [Kibdelosporangium lantanae]